jgi:membrane associated rhomboid family serine protease
MIPLKDNLRCKVFGWATLLLIALNCLAYIGESIALSGSADAAAQFMATYTMIPAKVVHAFASGDPHLIGMAVLSIFTSMFLHGGIMHLLGNMVFLFAFGPAMEARLGRFKYLAFYLLSGLFACALQVWSDPAATVFNLGASGAIAGVLGGYLLLWPKAEVAGIVFMPLPMPVKAVRAYWFMICWFSVQLLSVLQSGDPTSGGGVAYFAHIGGFIGGLAMALIARRMKPFTDVCYVPTEACTPCEKENDGGDEDGGSK